MLGLGAVLPGCRSAQRGASEKLPATSWPDRPVLPVAHEEPIPAPAPVPAPPPVAATMPGIIPRTSWASAGPRRSGEMYLMNGVQRITVHHSGMNSAGLSTREDVAHLLDNIRKEHLSRDPRFIDIGYHFIIDPQGRIWEGRSLAFQGGHVKAQNEHNLGICLLGNFDEQRPTGEQITSLNSLAPFMMRHFGVRTNRLHTHQELDRTTACPGRNLQRYMLAARMLRGAMFLA